MPICVSKLPFTVIMSDFKTNKLEKIYDRMSVENLDELVRKTVGEELSEEEDDLQCSQQITDLVADESECEDKPVVKVIDQTKPFEVTASTSGCQS